MYAFQQDLSQYGKLQLSYIRFNALKNFYIYKGKVRLVNYVWLIIWNTPGIFVKISEKFLFFQGIWDNFSYIFKCIYNNYILDMQSNTQKPIFKFQCFLAIWKELRVNEIRLYLKYLCALFEWYVSYFNTFHNFFAVLNSSL